MTDPARGERVELIVGAVYLCADGNLRRLDKTEHALLHYSVPIDEASGTWMALGGTWRRQIERDFREGRIVDAKIDRVIGRG